jgi:CHAT domain-containing protein
MLPPVVSIKRSLGRQKGMRLAWRVARLGGLLCALLGTGAGCGATSKGAADRQLGLESRLSGLAESAEPARTLERSRLLRALGQQQKALEELDRATSLARERLSWRDLAALWREVGGIQLELGRVEQALEAFGKRLESAVALEDAEQRASALVDTAYGFVLLNHVGQADEAMIEAKVLGGDALMNDPLSVERMAYVLDELNESVNANPEAQSLFERAAEGYRAAGDAAGAARVAIQAAELTLRSGDANALYRAEPLVQSSEDPEAEALLRRFQAQADLFGAAYDRCHEHAEQAIGLSDRRGLVEVATLARVLSARCGERLGRLDDAVRRAAEAGDLMEERLRYTSSELARQDLAYEAFRVYRLLLWLQASRKGAERVAESFVTSERARARAHLDALVRSRVAQFSDTLPVSSVLAQDRSEAEERVRQLTKALMHDRQQRKLAKKQDEALWALSEIKDAIQRSNPLLGRVVPPEPADLGQVRSALLGPDTLLLSYFVAGDRVLLFAVDAKNESLLELGSPTEEIDAAVKRFRAEHLLRPSGDLAPLRQAAAKLFDLLLGPVADRLAGKKRLLVIPHGRLAQLPFESLTGRDGRFLIESYDVSYSPSATLAVALAKRAGEKAGESTAKRRAFVGMGDPVYDWSAFAAGKAEGKAPVATRGLELWTESSSGEAAAEAPATLERLPGTARELRAIARLFGQDQKLYLREQANEELVKKGVLDGFRIVHIASHGLLAPHYQALALSLKPDATEDGFLMNSEIAELKLDADLVVLSACRTAGTVRDRIVEPVASLALGLRSAGARGVLLSLWSVDDDATADLMMRFYKPLAQASADYGRSLAEAKRGMIQDVKWAHPFYWAAFVLQG